MLYDFFPPYTSGFGEIFLHDAPLPLSVFELQHTHFAPQLPDLFNITVLFGLAGPLRECMALCDFSHLKLLVFVRFFCRTPH